MNVSYETIMLNSNDYKAQVFFDYFNERLRVDDYCGSIDRLLKVINEYVEKHQFSKIIFFAKSDQWGLLLNKGYELEAVMKGYFNGRDCYAMTFYKGLDRRKSHYWIDENDILYSIFKKGRHSNLMTIPAAFQFRKGEQKDAEQLANLYSQVFNIYPTPLNKSEYIKKQMKATSHFYIVEHNQKIVSAASADLNSSFQHAELTDCATLPEYRRYGLIKKLIILHEEELINRDIYCAFSIARALSYGMNAVLYQLGYEYGGRMTNNCYIFDKMEDMNVWTKDLSIHTPPLP